MAREMTSMRNPVMALLRRCFPSASYYYLYGRAARRLGDASRKRRDLFAELVAEGAGADCLQIGVRGSKFAPHWVSVDLYDHSEQIDHNYDVQDLPFSDGSFDIAVCNAVLEHVEHPERAIGELARVLRPGGRVWVEVPFNQPFHGAPGDFWRTTPAGLRIWMAAFDEIDSGFFRIYRSPIYTGVFYYGTKPADAADQPARNRSAHRRAKEGTNE
jgi:SAM-dependent methyltransferase